MCVFTSDSLGNMAQAMTPRQIQSLAIHSQQGVAKMDDMSEVCGTAGNRTTVRAIESPYAYNSRQRRRDTMNQADG